MPPLPDSGETVCRTAFSRRCLEAQVTQPRSEQLSPIVTSSRLEVDVPADEVLALRPCNVSCGFCGDTLSDGTPSCFSETPWPTQ